MILLHCLFFLFFCWVTGELSTLRQLMKVPNEPGSSPYQTLLVRQSSCVTPRVALTFGLLMGFAAMTIFISRRCGVHVYLGLAALTHFWFRSPSFLHVSFRPTRQKFLCVCWVDLNIVRPFCSVAMDKLGFELVNN